MSRALFLLLPALVFQAQDSAIPGAVEVRSGVFVLRGVPNDETCAAIKKQHITHVIDLRRDGEPSLNSEWESHRLQELNVQYLRYAIGTKPPAGDFDFLRTFLKDLPKGSKVLLHCGDGNRAAAVACSWLVLDKGMPLEEALRITKAAGLQLPETEDAVRRYVSKKG
jgi:protein-tyrosine phosphatase